jgi:2-C-methyl-D-erythritol 4-phosphate cytidylyltransferase
LPRDVGAVIVAGGDTPKQYRLIAGVPMVLRALRPFAAHPEVAQVVLVLPPDDARHHPDFLAGLSGNMLTVVAGGAARHDSVRAGLGALRAECTVVLVHDAARPFVEPAVIDRVIAHARAGVSAIAAVPLADTLKEASATDPERVTRTIPRERLWRAQTPQGFPRAVLERAHGAGGPSVECATDDAALVEALGEPVALVPDSPRNFKVTTADDFALAELLAARPELRPARAR